MKQPLKLFFACLIAFPPLLLYPLLFLNQIDKMHYRETWNLSQNERKIFFLKIAMPGLENDYFELLDKTLKIMGSKKQYFAVVTGNSVSPFVSLMVHNFTVYWLCPSRTSEDPEKLTYKLYYRTPPASGEKILETIQGPENSYLVEIIR